MPQGLSPSVEGFQGLMVSICGRFLYVLIYLDDILIFSYSEEEPVKHVKAVVEALLDSHVIINLTKSKISVTTLKYPGFILTSKGIKANPAKIDAILSMPMPNSQATLRSQLGCLNFFRRFVPHMATILAPLSGLTSKKHKFVWTKDLGDSLNHVKHLLAAETLLVYPNFTKVFHVYCDASDYGLGVVVDCLKNDKSTILIN